MQDLKLMARKINTPCSDPCFATLGTSSLNRSDSLRGQITEHEGETFKALQPSQGCGISLSGDPSPPCCGAFHESPRIFHLDL